eukprot:tig00001094_g7004.t1
MPRRKRVTVLGAGSWGTAIAKICGENTRIHRGLFEEEVRVWVYDEMVEGRWLSEWITSHQINPRYMPGVKLPTNLRAVTELEAAVKDADVLVFVIPHQFLHSICKQMQGKILRTAKAISLSKGAEYHEETKQLWLSSDTIKAELGIETAVLMGANIASEIAEERFSETTVGCYLEQDGEMFRMLFDRPFFRVSVIHDVKGPELCGALKNVIALAAGFCDGLKMGDNTKAAVMRLGLMEMMKFSKTFFTGVLDRTFLESCGVADLITTCAGGRHRRCGEAFVRTGKSWEELEAELLNGQKLQGQETCVDVYRVLSARNMLHEFPLLTRIYKIAFEKAPPASLFEDL